MFIIKNLFRELYETIGKALSEIQTQREEEEFEQMKNIDLCKALKGTEYMTRFIRENSYWTELVKILWFCRNNNEK